MTDRLVAALRAALDGAVLTDPADLAPYSRDWLGKREGRPLAVARPASAEGVAAVLRLCAEAGVGVVPQGGNTGMVGGATPDADGRQVILSLSRLNRIRALDRVGDVVVAEAGCTVAAVKAAAAAEGRALPFGIGADGSAQVGGILSTNAGGHMALRSGVARDLVLGLEAVLPDGTLLPGPKTLRKDNTGFDVARLLLGAEGCLGIITAAALRLVPLPVETATALVALPDVEAALRLLVRLKEGAGHRLAAFELMMPEALRLAVRHVPAARGAIGPDHGAYALVELDDVVPGPALRDLAETLLGAALEDGTAGDVVLAESLDRRVALWALRESFPEAQGREGLSLKHDIALPVPELAAFIRRAGEVIPALFPMLTPIVYGHAGDGNLHWNLQAATRSLPDGIASASRAALYDLVAEHGGSFSAEHGVGRAYPDHLVARSAPGRIAAMRRVKAALDPAGHMNPGAVLGP